MTATHTVTFSISGTVKQAIRIVDNRYQSNEIASLLTSGTLVTTTWFNRLTGSFDAHITDIDGHVVAEILSQEIDGDYEDFVVTSAD